MRTSAWRLVERWLSRRLPARSLDAVLGDLQDDYARRRATAGRTRAAVWLWREARSVARAYRESQLRVRRAGWAWTATSQDVRYALRHFRGRPALALAAALTLAIGLGANLAVFAVARAVLFPNLPYPAAERIVNLYTTRVDRQSDGFNSPGLFRAWREGGVGVLEAVAAYRPRGLTLTGAGPEAIRLSVIDTTPDLFGVMNVRPRLGRALAESDAAGAGRSIVISHDLWRDAFGEDPGAVGRRIELDGEPWTVVGVMPAGVAFPRTAGVDGWTPLVLPEMLWRQTGPTFLEVTARLGPDATLEAASPALAAVTRAAFGEDRPNYTSRVARYLDGQAAPYRAPLAVLAATSALVLVIAAVNIANLLLASAATRRHELALRASLGAGRLRLARQLLTEAAVLCAGGAILAMVLAAWIGPALLARYPAAGTPFQPVAIGLPEFGVALALLVLTVLATALAPIVSMTRSDASQSLADAGRAGVSKSHRATQSVLVAAEVTLAVILLVGGALLARSYYVLTTQPLGFDPRHIVTARVSLPAARYPTPEARAAFAAALVDRLDDEPGVVGVAVATRLPFDLSGSGGGVEIDLGAGAPVTLAVGNQVVSSGYFTTLGIPIRAGQPFAAGLAGQGDVVVNEAFARVIQADPAALVGRRLRRRTPDAPWITIAGVAANSRPAFRQDVRPEVYLPMAAEGAGAMTIVARGTGPAAPPVAVLAARVAAVDPALPLERTRTYDEIIAASVGRDRFNAALLALVAGLAMLLAAVGIAGVTAHMAGQRMREVGIRLALGATPGGVRRLVVAQGLRPVAAGLVAGLAGAWWSSAVLESVLFEIEPRDAATFAAVAALIIIVGLAACWWPARQATRVDPAVTLRAE
jgi:predicted permease